MLDVHLKKVRIGTKRLILFFLYDNPLVRILRHPITMMVLPGIVVSYHTSLDLWKDDWPFFTKFPDLHAFLFGLSVFLSLVTLFFAAVGKLVEERRSRTKGVLIDQFTLLTSKVVRIKLDRFKEKAETLTPKGSTFKAITQPKDQINLILSEVIEFFRVTFGIDEHESCLTILHFDPMKKNGYISTTPSVGGITLTQTI